MALSRPNFPHPRLWHCQCETLVYLSFKTRRNLIYCNNQDREEKAKLTEANNSFKFVINSRKLENKKKATIPKEDRDKKLCIAVHKFCLF